MRSYFDRAKQWPTSIRWFRTDFLDRITESRTLVMLRVGIFAHLLGVVSSIVYLGDGVDACDVLACKKSRLKLNMKVE